jgi:hypothetical protein
MAQIKSERQATLKQVARRPTGGELSSGASAATMTTLPVPFRPQKFKYSCAAASLEMAALRYEPDENTESWQKDMMEKLSGPVPDGSDDEGISGDKIIAKAEELGFHAGGGRVSPDPDEMIRQVTLCIAEYGMPLIAYQRLTDEEPRVGHCRVIFGVCENGVMQHDPHTDKGGPNLKWNWSQLRDFWLRTGDNVTGGVAIWVGKKDRPKPENFLLPIESDAWLHYTWRPGTILP